MQRYFIDASQMDDDLIYLTDDNARHLMQVMRAKPGMQVLVVANQQTYLACVVEVGSDRVVLKNLEKVEEDVELPISVTIAQGIIKADKFDWVLQKGTECGASCFIPVAMERSIVKLDAKKEKKRLERWEKIVYEAARQSHRQVVPSIKNVHNLDELIARASEYDLLLFADEADAGKGSELVKMIESIEVGAELLVLIGPEGGISPVERAKLIDAGFIPVGLGPRILRTETAPIYVLSAISYELELRKGSKS